MTKFKAKYKYAVDAFYWIPRKDHSGNDKCYTDAYNVKTIFGVCICIIKCFMKSKNEGVTILKF